MEHGTYMLHFRKADRGMFLLLRRGKKRVETRAATKRYRDMREGDVVMFACGRERFTRVIKKARRFKSVTAMLRVYKPGDIDPRIRHSAALVKMFHSYPYYEEKLKKHGLIALELGKSKHISP